MESALAFAIGGLYAAGLYLMLRRNAVRLVFGLVLLGHGANLLIFTMGGLTRAHPPIVPAGATAPAVLVADPLPQALILTAIVIGFGLQAFTLVLIGRTINVTGTDDLDAMTSTDRLESESA